MIVGAVPKRRRNIDEIMRGDRQVIMVALARKEDQVMETDDVMEPAPSIELGSQVVEAIRKM